MKEATMSIRSAVPLAPCLLSLLIAPALGKEKLQWKLKVGDSFTLEEKTDLSQRITFMKTEVRQRLTYTRVSRFTVVKKTGEDGYLLEQKIQAVKVKPVKGSGKIDAKLLRGMKGATFKITLNARMRVTKLEGYEALLKKLATSEQTGKMIRALLPREALTQGVENQFVFLPDKAVDKGNVWKHELTRPLGPLGTLKLTNSYTLKGKDMAENKPVVKIEVINTRSTFTPPPGGGASGFQVVKGRLKVVDRKETKGAIYFSPAQGRLVKSVTSLHLEGTLTVAVMGTTLAMDLKHEARTVVRLK
jgi:hypothetical protein